MGSRHIKIAVGSFLIGGLLLLSLVTVATGTTGLLWEWVSNNAQQFVLPVLVYSGAVVPLSVAIIFDRKVHQRRRFHWRILLIVFWVQAASFLPFIVALLLHAPHAIHGLIWPALMGGVLFLLGLVYSASQLIELLTTSRNPTPAGLGTVPSGGMWWRFWSHREAAAGGAATAPRLRRAFPAITLVSGLIGLLLATFFGLVLWRILWLSHHSDFRPFDWSPLPEWLNLALNWWVPFSLLICAASIYFASKRRRSASLIVGWCLHSVSIIGLITLGLWVYTGPLEGGGRGVWWMQWLA